MLPAQATASVATVVARRYSVRTGVEYAVTQRLIVVSEYKVVGA